MEKKVDPLIELPLELPGRVFRSPMPFSEADPQGKIFKDYLRERVSVVVILASDEECEWHTGRNLRSFYESKGLETLYCPIPDFGLPDLKDFNWILSEVILRANRGKNIAVHCYAGLGRTGTFLACLARRVLKLSGQQAVTWVRTQVPGALETPEQVKFVTKWKG